MWETTPEGRAYARAREKDWEEVGKSSLDQVFADTYHDEVLLLEEAAEILNYHWGRNTWAVRSLMEAGAMPNRLKWAKEWLNRRY